RSTSCFARGGGHVSRRRDRTAWNLGRASRPGNGARPVWRGSGCTLLRCLSASSQGKHRFFIVRHGRTAPYENQSHGRAAKDEAHIGEARLERAPSNVAC